MMSAFRLSHQIFCAHEETFRRSVGHERCGVSCQLSQRIRSFRCTHAMASVAVEMLKPCQVLVKLWKSVEIHEHLDVDHQGFNK